VKGGGGVLVGFGTGVLVGFFVGCGAGFFVAVGGGAVAEAVGIDVKVGAAVGGGVSVGTGVLVGAGVGIGVSVGVGVAEGVSVWVAVAVKVKVGLGVRVSVAVARASCWGTIPESAQAPISQMAMIEPIMIRRILGHFGKSCVDHRRALRVRRDSQIAIDSGADVRYNAHKGTE
jgi:hypothetical protein